MVLQSKGWGFDGAGPPACYYQAKVQIMDQKLWLKCLQELADELKAAGNARPYDPDNYDRIVYELNALHLARQADYDSSAVLRFLKWAGKRGFAAAARLKKIFKRGVT